ncbi:uncharacterized protein LOC113290912 [Papaver somniferum]|uniref:uncharacterized protein LOC113290912 n=1 Tax=Papaver somniferum TaxID=3469 RepID=UPI000E6F9AF4|nr:uncharacterized protein LOC113290912 [Papaver somniferum]
MIPHIRDKPICRIGILYSQLVNAKWHERRQEAEKWPDEGLVPKEMNLIKKMCKLTGPFDVNPCVFGKLYEVTSVHNSVFTVNLEEKTCSYLQWQLRGFVCIHAVCALKGYRPKWNKYCSHYYSVAAFRATYEPHLKPLVDVKEWVKVEMELNPLKSGKKTGRPRVKRRRAYDEPPPQPRVCKCRRCGIGGHNSKGCSGGAVGQNSKAPRQRTQVDGETLTSFDKPAATSSRSKKRNHMILQVHLLQN